MRHRVDPPAQAIRGTHSLTAQGHGPPRPAEVVPHPLDRSHATTGLGTACDWLFAKGGMSAVLMLGLLATPLLAVLPGGRVAQAAPRVKSAPRSSETPSARVRSVYCQNHDNRD